MTLFQNADRTGQIKLIFVALVFAEIAACGGGGGGDGEPPRTDTSARALTGSLADRYAVTSRCAGMEAPPPEIELAPTVECPTSGERRCLADGALRPCAHDPSKTCGEAGRYVSSTATIVLPQEYDGAFEHEAIHHLFWWNFGDGDPLHRDPVWSRCG